MSDAPRRKSRLAPALRGLEAYRIPRAERPVDLRLDGNEGAAPPDSLLDALRAAAPDVLRRYPDATALERALAARHGVAPERVLVTAGADEALDRACRALLSPGDAIVLPVPTFEMLPHYARLAGARAIEVPWPSGPYPLDAVLRAASGDAPEAKAIALVSPNNPTGAAATASDIDRLASNAPAGAALLVDAAYAEFADEDLTASALAHGNAIVFRTLSKAWGLAGLRVGYAIAEPEVISWLRAAGGPYSVAGPALALALARLENGAPDVARFVAAVRAERASLAATLRELGAEPIPSQANFVLARFENAAFARDALLGLGIAVRGFPGREPLRDALRITCPGSASVLARLEAALRAALAPEALLLDIDGVLADDSRSYRVAVVETAKSFGVALTLADVALAKAAGGANDDWSLTRRLLENRGVAADLAEVTRRFEAIYQGTGDRPGLRATESLIPARSTLERLAARLPLAAVTGRPRRDAVLFLERAGVLPLFRTLVCREDAPRMKPDPAPVRTALERLSVASAWMVGDTPDDVRAARAAGVVPIGVVAPGDDAAAEATLLSAGAARVLARFDELETLLP